MPIFFVIRREHIHDFRGSQLAGTDALADVSPTEGRRFAAGSILIDRFLHAASKSVPRGEPVGTGDMILLRRSCIRDVSGLQPLTLCSRPVARLFRRSREVWMSG